MKDSNDGPSLPLSGGILEAPPPAAADLEALRALYAENRFLDAFACSRDAWRARALPEGLDAEALIFIGRLAGRVGARTLRLVLFRLAARREPESAHVRYYADFASRSRTLFDHLLELERRPHLETDDPDLLASWYAQSALNLTVVRDFDGARRALDRAEACGPPSAWLDSCHAAVLLAEDRFEEAHALAERAWEKSPGMPNGAHMLTSTLTALGRQEEAAARLLSFSRGHRQSWEVLASGIHAALAVAERAPGEHRARLGEEILAETEALAALAPLADRWLRRFIDVVRFHAAQLAGDRPQMRRFAAQIGGPFFREVTQHMEAHPEGERFLLQHRFSRQRHNTCMPASIAACLGAFGHEVDQDELARALTFEGTSWWRVRDWAEAQGYRARSFTATVDTTRALLEAGLPFIISHQYMDAANACTAVGLDRSLGTLLYHDPSADRLQEVLLERFGALEAPLGPRAMLLLPAAEVHRAAGMVLPDEAAQTARTEVDRLLERAPDPQAVAAVVQELARSGVSGPLVDYLEARVAAVSNQRARAYELFRALLEAHPTSLLLQRAAIDAVTAFNNPAALRELLRSIVERTPLPGFSRGGDWIRPEPHLVVRYADLLRQSASHRAEARRYLDRALRADPQRGEAYHILGDLSWAQGQRDAAELAHRFGSTLDYGDEHAAEAYAWALRAGGKDAAAVAWLERRVAHFSGEVGHEGPWITSIRYEELAGRPQEALARLERARRERPKSGALAAFAAGMWARHGRTAEAEIALADARAHGAEAQWVVAALNVAQTTGHLEEAHARAARWVELSPTDLTAREALLETTRAHRGADAATDLAKLWVREHAEDERFECLLLGQLEQGGREDEREALLEARVARDPLDAWAWRELASVLASQVAALDPERRPEALPKLHRAVERCVATGPEHPFTIVLQAEAALLGGDQEEARAHLNRAIEEDGGADGAKIRLLDLSRGASEEEKRAVLAAIDRAEERRPAGSHASPALLRRLVALVGFEEAAALARRWLERAPDEPDLTEAWADLHLAHGAGRPSAELVLPHLEAAVARFPLHTGLRHSLARAHRALGHREEAIRELKALAALSPRLADPHAELAYVLMDGGELAEAEVELRRATELAPLYPGHHLTLADVLALRGELNEALLALDGAIEKLPDVIDLWERRIELSFVANRPEEAVATAAALEARFPSGAYAVLVHARTLARAPAAVEREELEALYQRAIGLNAELFEALSDWVDYLCHHARFTEARGALEAKLAAYADPLPIRRKLAEVLRREGETASALEALAALLRDRPDDARGWEIAIEWIEEDQAWSLARSLFPLMRAVSAEHAILHCERLRILERAGAPAEEIEAEWGELTRNFPQSRVVNLMRVDQLFERGRFEDASLVLEAYAQRDAASPSVLARQARAHAQRGARREALDYAFQVAAHPRVQSEASLRLALDALDDAHLLDALLERALTAIEAGERVLQPALVMLAARVTRMGQLEKLWSVLAREDLGWDTSTVLAHVLDVASHRFERHAWVIELAHRHPERVNENVELWASVGPAYVRSGDHARGKAWLEDWRQRRGVELWCVSHYATACWELGDLEACAEACSDALEVLAHDHSAPMVAQRLLLVHLLRDTPISFGRDLERYHPLLERGGEALWAQEWFELFETVRAAEPGDGGLVAVALRAEALRGDAPEFMVERLREWVGPKLSVWGQLWVWIVRFWTALLR